MTLRRAGPYGLLLVASLLACSRILVLPGWPENHDGVACFQKVEIFRRAFADGNLLPLWTPLAENGYGSPFPFFYHRLFNTLAGAVALATGSAYTAVKVMIPLLLFMGALGMRRALFAMGLGPFHAMSGALLLVFSNYAYTDWVVRGAFGEFAAFMLVPWLTFAALGVVEGKPRAGWGLGAVLSLIFFAQSTIFVFAFALVLVAFAGALVLSKDRRRALLNLGQAALVVLPVTGPFVLGIWLFGKDLDLDRLRTGMFSVFRNFVPLEEYLYDRVGGWTSSTAGYSVEIGRGFNTLSLVCFAAVAAGLARRNPRVREMLPAWLLAGVRGPLFRPSDASRGAPLPSRASDPVHPVSLAPTRLLDPGFDLRPVPFARSPGSKPAAPGGSIRPPRRAALRRALPGLVRRREAADRPDLGREGNRGEPDDGTARRHGAQQGVSPARNFAAAAAALLRGDGLRRHERVPGGGTLGHRGRPGAPPHRRRRSRRHLVINQFANPFLAVSAGGEGCVGTTAWGTILVRPAPGRSEIVMSRLGLSLAALQKRLFGS